MIWLGIALALVTSVSWAFGNVLTQRLSKLMGPPRAMLWALGSGGVMALPFAIVFDDRGAPFTQGIAAWTAVAALAGVVAYLTMFYAYANAVLSIAVPIVTAWALVSSVVAMVFFGESLRGWRLVGACAVLLGVVLVSLPQRAAKATELTNDEAIANFLAPKRMTGKALLASVASAVAFGVMVPAMGRITPATGAFGASVIVYVFGIALALSVGRVTHRAAARESMRPPPVTAWLLVLATGASETLGFVAIALARRFAPMTLVAPVSSLSSTLTVLYAWVVMRERPTGLAAVGALLAGVGVALLAA